MLVTKKFQSQKNLIHKKNLVTKKIKSKKILSHKKNLVTKIDSHKKIQSQINLSHKKFRGCVIKQILVTKFELQNLGYKI